MKAEEFLPSQRSFLQSSLFTDKSRESCFRGHESRTRHLYLNSNQLRRCYVVMLTIQPDIQCRDCHWQCFGVTTTCLKKNWWVVTDIKKIVKKMWGTRAIWRTIQKILQWLGWIPDLGINLSRRDACDGVSGEWELWWTIQFDPFLHSAFVTT